MRACLLWCVRQCVSELLITFRALSNRESPSLGRFPTKQKARLYEGGFTGAAPRVMVRVARAHDNALHLAWRRAVESPQFQSRFALVWRVYISPSLMSCVSRHAHAIKLSWRRTRSSCAVTRRASHGVTSTAENAFFCLLTQNISHLCLAAHFGFSTTTFQEFLPPVSSTNHRQG